MAEEQKQTVHKLFHHANDLSKTEALHLLSSHLRGSWSTIQEDAIEVTVIQAGFVNRIFVCHNKKLNEKVLLRLYGGKIIESEKNILRNVALEGEVLIFHLMDVHGIGPRLLGVFDGGRIEGYMEGSNSLSNEDIANDQVMSALARKLAKMHSLEIPVDKNPKDFIAITTDQFTEYWDSYRQYMIETKISEDTPEILKNLVKKGIEYDFYSVIHWYAKNLPSIKSRTVFSHNDLNRGNIMVDPNKTGPDMITLLDFEFAGYNYRGCDIGHHFKMRTRDLAMWLKKTEDGQPKNSLTLAQPYPTEEQRRVFIKSYLEEAKQYCDVPDESIDNEDHLLIEAEFFGGLYQLFFVSFFMAPSSGFHKVLPFHPGVMMGGVATDFEERKARIIDLQTRFLSKSIENVSAE